MRWVPQSFNNTDLALGLVLSIVLGSVVGLAMSHPLGGVSANRVHGFGRFNLQSYRRPAGISGLLRSPGRAGMAEW
jgi:hypothetical protein